jgi:hypothetical protein
MLRRRLHVWHADLLGAGRAGQLPGRDHNIELNRVDVQSGWLSRSARPILKGAKVAAHTARQLQTGFFHFVASPIVDLFLLETSLPRFLPFVEHEI